MGGGGEAAFSLKNLRTFTSFKNPVYRLFYGAMVSQMASMNMQMLARGLLIYRITGSATVLGIMALANAIPMLLFSLFGGVIADRVPKKKVLLLGQAASAANALIIAITMVTGMLSEDRPNSWLILIATSLVQGVIQGLMMPSRQAIIAEIVGQEELMNALALNNLGMNLNRLMMPALAGFLIDAVGFQAIYFTMTGLYLLAVTFISMMPQTGTTMTLAGAGAIADVLDGLKYVRSQTTILVILIITFFSVLLSMPYMMLLPIFVDDVLEVGARGMGILISVSGIGALVGSLVLASLPNKKRGLMLLLGMLILGLALFGFSFSSLWFPSYAWPFALGCIVFVGLGQTSRMTLANTLLQYYVEDEYRGRVMSLYMMEFGLTSFGVFFAAVMAESIGVQWSVGGLAIILIVLSILALAFVPRIRKLD
jgi:MFS family permease